MRKALLFLIILGAMTSITCSRRALQTTRQDYLGTELRLDGVYYNKPQKAHFFLYRNGVFFDGGTGFRGSVNDLMKFYSQKENYITAYQLPYAWGVFSIENNQILIEKWVSSDAFGIYTTTNFDGAIINDTTLLLNYPIKSIAVDTFYFHKLSEKPDSTNTFIK